MNLHSRRHLDTSHRATVAARLTTLKDGKRQVGNFAEVATQPKAAAMLNVLERVVRDARKVVDGGVTPLVVAVERGKIVVSAATKIAELARLTDYRNITCSCGEAQTVGSVKTKCDCPFFAKSGLAVVTVFWMSTGST